VSRHGTSAAAFAGYLTLSFLFFGVRVVAHPEATHVGGLAADPQIFIWSFAWWPHAILHGENPLFTHAIWAPDGFDLAWATSVPGLALLFAPLTLAFGPVLSYNVACILMPSLSAWTAFVLCRHVTRSTWPALAGGYLFGFSAYMLGHPLAGHLNLTAVFLVPLATLLVLRFVEGTLGGRALAFWLAAVLVAQMALSTEILFTLTLALACALVLAFGLVPAARPRLIRLPVPLAAGYALAAIVASPFLYFVLTGNDFKPPPGPEEFVADALNLVAPTRVEAVGWWASSLAGHFPTNDAERGAYLGVPTLVIVVWFAVRRLRTPVGRFLLAALALAVVASLGSWLTVDGHRLVTLPWIHFAYLPLVEHVLPVRLVMYTSLVAAVIVAIWAASPVRPSWIRVALPLLAVLAIVPNVSLAVWARSPHVPSFFTTDLRDRCLRKGENVIVFPYGPRGDSLIWQAEGRFRFRIAGGYISPLIPESFLHPHAITHVTTADHPSEVKIGAILELAREKGVSAILVGARNGNTWRGTLASLGPPTKVGGVLVYRVPGERRGATGPC
jgi:hypothetical protein